MPGVADLPLNLVQLSFLQAMPLRSETFDDDADKIALRLKELIAPRRRALPYWVAGAATASALLVGLASGHSVVTGLGMIRPSTDAGLRTALEQAHRRTADADTARKEAEAKYAAAADERDRAQAALKNAEDEAGRDAVLGRLQRQIALLTDQLSAERSRKKAAEDEAASLHVTLSAAEVEKKRLAGLLTEGAAGTQAAALTKQLTEQRGITAQAFAQIELLNRQIVALRKQIAALEDSLGEAEKQDKTSQARIADLGQRLKVALARRVPELAQYRVAFFIDLKKSLGDRDDVQLVGDRFVFQSEIFFAGGGSAELRPSAYKILDTLAAAIQKLEGQLPRDVDWLLRIDGHTDIRPVPPPAFRSNWELSSARTVSIVQYLVSKGAPANRLLPAGFGEYRPLAAGVSEADLQWNRRIELKLTEK